MGGCYELYIHSNYNNFTMFINFFRSTNTKSIVERRQKTQYNSKAKIMMEKVLTLLVGLLIALGGWSLSRTFELSTGQVVLEDKVERLEMQLNLMDQKMDEMFDMDEEIMEQHEELFKKLQNSNTGYSYN